MPQSGRKREAEVQPSRMSPQMRDVLDALRTAFIAKFGRQPGPADPVIFDSEKDVPTPVSKEADVLRAMQKAGLPPEFVYAYKKTGLLGVAGDKTQLRSWNNAVDEYRAIHAAPKRAGGKSGPPRPPKTRKTSNKSKSASKPSHRLRRGT
jgi:hypothetical protein